MIHRRWKWDVYKHQSESAVQCCKWNDGLIMIYIVNKTKRGGTIRLIRDELSYFKSKSLTFAGAFRYSYPNPLVEVLEKNILALELMMRSWFYFDCKLGKIKQLKSEENESMYIDKLNRGWRHNNILCCCCCLRAMHKTHDTGHQSSLLFYDEVDVADDGNLKFFMDSDFGFEFR